MADPAGTPSLSPASRCRLVATAWASDPDGLADRVRVAADTFDALGPDGSAHLVEARFDLLERKPSAAVVERIVRAAGSRLLATCRPGGPGSPTKERDRVRLLERALAAGAHACDVERGSAAPPMPPGTILVRSHHAEAALRPEEAAALARELAAADPAPGIVKLVSPAESAHDAFAWADAAAAALPGGVDLAAVATGPAGAWMRQVAPASRLAGGRPLSALAYVRAAEPLPGGDLGQPLLSDALGTWRIPSVTERTRLLAVIGWPLPRTWSPRLHDALFRRRGVDARLVALPIRDAAEASVLEALRIEGVAATMPHKPLAAALAARKSARVARLGSGNTLRRRDGAWEAEDFDGPAAAAALARALPLAGAKVVVVGAGGAARAAALALVEAGARVAILARRADEARRAAGIAGAAEHGGLEAAPIRAADALVQATPCGSADEPPLALPEGALPKAAVLDMVTTPPETPLLRAARAAGLSAVDGLVMLALQAAWQQRWWSDGTDDAACLPESEVEQVLRDVAAFETRA